MNESEKQLSFTRAASITGGRAKNQIPISSVLAPDPTHQLVNLKYVFRDFHVDPLRCPVCQNPMRVIAIIDDPQVVEQLTSSEVRHCLRRSVVSHEELHVPRGQVPT